MLTSQLQPFRRRRAWPRKSHRNIAAAISLRRLLPARSSAASYTFSAGVMAVGSCALGRKQPLAITPGTMQERFQIVRPLTRYRY